MTNIIADIICDIIILWSRFVDSMINLWYDIQDDWCDGDLKYRIGCYIMLVIFLFCMVL
jgi:hypothetical protein